LVTTEAVYSPLNAPDSDLGRQIFIYLFNNIALAIAQLERDDIAGCMHSFIGSGTPDKSRLFGIICIGF